MRAFSMKTKLIAVGVGAATLGLSGVAYAYWTTSGSGTGSATAGSDVAADKIALAQVGSISGFYPGGAAQNIVVKAHNPAAFSQKVGEVTVTVADSGVAGGCTASNWQITNVADSFGILAAGGDSDPAGQTVATIALKETGVNQDVCKGVTPVLTFTSASGA